MVLERQEHGHVDIIIVDPLRKGLDLEVSLTLLGKTVEDKVAKVTTNATAVASSLSSSPSSTPQIRNAKQQILIYVSCGFDAFVRDYHVLTKQPGATTSGTTALGRPPLPHRSSTTSRTLEMRSSRRALIVPSSDAIETFAIFTR
jgi:hypothetical protein